MTYDDRLDARAYVDEPQFGVGLGQETPDRDAVWIPERVMERLVWIGRAYQLHLLPLVDLQGVTYFNDTQCEQLGVELDFIGRVVNDPVLHHHAREMRSLVQRAREGAGLTFDGG